MHSSLSCSGRAVAKGKCSLSSGQVNTISKKKKKKTEAIIYKNNNSSLSWFIDWFLVYMTTLYLMQGLFTLAVFGRVFM
jgi:hypothetical protein